MHQKTSTIFYMYSIWMWPTYSHLVNTFSIFVMNAKVYNQGFKLIILKIVYIELLHIILRFVFKLSPPSKHPYTHLEDSMSEALEWTLLKNCTHLIPFNLNF